VFPVSFKSLIPEVNSVRRKEARIVIALIVLYLAIWIMLPKPSFWGLDNGFKFQGAVAFANTGQLKVPYSGADFDPGGGFRPMPPPFGEFDGAAQIPVFPVLFMILSGVFYKIFGTAGPYLLPLLGGWLCILSGWFMWIRFRPDYDGSAYLIILALGSPLLFYSMTLWEHSIATALVTLSFAFLIQNQQLQEDSNPRVREVTVAGFLIALATAFRTEAIFWVAVPLFFWRSTERNYQDIGRYMIGLAAGLVGLMLLNHVMTGKIYPLHILSNIDQNPFFSYKHIFYTRLYNLHILLTAGFKDVWFKSLILLLPLLVTVMWRGWRRERDWGYYLAGFIFILWVFYFYSMIKNLNLSIYPVKTGMMNTGGLLWIVPFAVLSLLPIKSKRLPRYWRIFWLSPIIYIIIIAAFTPTVWGVHWGPRFIVTALPILLIVGSVRAQRWWHRYSITKIIVIVLVVISIINQFYSYGVLMKIRNNNVVLNRWVARTGSEPSIVHGRMMWYMPGDLSLLSDHLPWYIIWKDSRFGLVIDALRKRGTKSFDFYEKPPYKDSEFWWKVGAEPMETEYFLDGDPTLRRVRLKIHR